MDNIKLVVFDLYGTLIYLPNKFKSYIKMTRALALDDNKLQPDKFASLMTMDFRNLDEMKEMVFPKSDADMGFWQKEISDEVDSAKLFPETISVLESLKDRGYVIGVISNLATPYKKPFYTLGIDKYCSCRIFSCEAGYKKPDIEIYRLMENKFSIRGNKVIMIGDNYITDYAAPIFLGWRALLLSRTEKKSVVPTIKNLNEISDFI